MAPYYPLAAAGGGKEPSLCLSRSRSWTAISQSGLSGSGSPVVVGVEVPLPGSAAAGKGEEQRAPRVLALLERVSASQHRLEAKLDAVASALASGAEHRDRGGGGGCPARGRVSETELPMSHTSSWDLSEAFRAMEKGGCGGPKLLESASVTYGKPLDVPDPPPIPEKAGTACFSFAMTGTDWKEDILDEELLEEELGLPTNWPASLQIRESLASEAACTQSAQGRRLSKRPALAIARVSQTSGAAGDGYGGHCLCMFDPSSRLLLAWHIISAIVLLYDLVMIPYILAWDVQFDKTVFLLGAWSRTWFWTMDILLTFRTGYYNRAELVLDPRKVAANYLTTWFFIDALLVLCDVASMIVEFNLRGRSVNLLRMSKLGRILRITGVLRMYRLVQLVENHMSHDEYQLTTKIISMILQMVCFNHVASCAWFAVGMYAPTDTGNHWVDDLQASSHQEFYEYITSLHWSVAQFTLGGTDINCTNSVERAFNICFLLVGLVWSSTVISNLSATAIDFNIHRAETLKKVRQVAQFFRENRVARRVAQQVHEQVRERLSRKESLLYSDVEAFAVLSTSVQRSLLYELIKPYFKRDGLFKLWSRLERATVQEICHHACQYRTIMRMDDLFTPHAEAKGAYYLATGSLYYTQSPTSAPVEEDIVEEVVTGTWVAEAALWSNRTHVGAAEAIVPSQLLAMNGDALAAALQKGFLVREVTVAYCQQFYKNLLAARPPRRQWPNDLRVPFTDYATMVYGIDRDLQEMIGMDAVENMYFGGGRIHSLRANVDALMEDVRSGSVIVLNAANDLEHLISEVTLVIQDDEERTLIQVARQDGAQQGAVPLGGAGGIAAAGCRPPCGPQRPGESPEAALQRLVEAELAFLNGKVSFGEMEQQQEVKMKRHAKYSISTKCLRIVCHARLTESVDHVMSPNKVQGRGTTLAIPFFATAAQGGRESSKPWAGISGAAKGSMRRMRSSLGSMRSTAASWRTTAASSRVTTSPSMVAAGSATTTELLSSIGLYTSGEEGRLGFYTWVTPTQLLALQETPERTLRQWVEYHHARRCFGASDGEHNEYPAAASGASSPGR